MTMTLINFDTELDRQGVTRLVQSPPQTTFARLTDNEASQEAAERDFGMNDEMLLSILRPRAPHYLTAAEIEDIWLDDILPITDKATARLVRNVGSHIQGAGLKLYIGKPNKDGVPTENAVVHRRKRVSSGPDNGRWEYRFLPQDREQTVANLMQVEREKKASVRRNS